MDRRNFIRAVALAGAAISVKQSGAMTVVNQVLNAEAPAADAAANAVPQAGKVDLAAILGGEPEAMFKRAIAEMGGMGKFIKKGWKVVIKPNIGWDRSPELAGNTNPALITEIIRQCKAAGASQITVFDHTCDDWRKCYQNSGIEAAAKAAGAKVVPADLESYYKPVSLPRGKTLKNAKIHEAIVDADAWINVPILKNHGGAKLTIAMKNYMGIVWNRGFFHRNDLQQCIADVATYSKKPVLTVVDAYRVMKSNGPRGRSAADVVLAKGLFVSQDMVAADTAAARFFDQIQPMPLEHVTHIKKAEELKVGTTNLDALKVKRVKM